MAGSQQGILDEAPTVSVDESDLRLSLPEATMFIVASSGALWVLLFGVMNLLLS